MKHIYKILGLTAIVIAFISCASNDGIRPASPLDSGTNNTAGFLLINAVPDGSSLDFYVNGLQVGTSVDISKGQNGYTTVPITTPGLNSIANTSIRAKSTLGGSSDIIYRAGNTSTSNMVAALNGLYTFIALDTVSRPVPLRTFSINTVTNALAADLTYYNIAKGQQISLDDYKLLSSTDKLKFVSLGVIPPGITDPGGSRFLLLTDTYLAFTNLATQSQIRFINAVPNAYATPTDTRIFARLKPTAGATISLAGGTTGAEYIMSVAGGFNPTVGSRSTTVPFTLQATGTNVYTLELSTNNFATIAFALPNVKFEVGKIYTIVATGIVGKTGTKGLNAAIAQHN